MKTTHKPTLSFIIPLKDEAPTLKELYSRIAEQANEHASDWEIIFIDDGSDDNSWNIIKELAKEAPDHVRALKFRTNRSKAPALATGYREANGEFVFTLDADLQDDPKEIPRFLEKINEGDGWDIVSGYKATRHDPWHKVLPSRIFNWMLSKVNGVNLHDHNCGFKCYRQDVVKHLPMYGEMHRMVPSLAAIEGYRTTEIVVEHHARQHGVSKYGFSRFLRGFFDMWSVFFVRTYRERPLHFAGAMAIFCVLVAVGLWALAVIPQLPEPVRTAILSTAPAVFAVAPVSLVIGFMAELVTNRRYKEGIEVPVEERIEINDSVIQENVIQMNAASEQPVAAKSLHSFPSIIVADDDTVTRALTKRILEAEGWRTTPAETAEQALELITPETDVVLLDIYLPGMSGLDVLPKIKQLAPKTQVVILSASEKAADGAQAIKAGGFDFLSKPVKKVNLLNTVNQALDASRALRPKSQVVAS